MFFEKTENCVRLRVKLTPNASAAGVKGIVDGEDGEYLKIAVKSPPEKGKANGELLKFVANMLDLPKSAVELVGGATSHYKKLKITGEAEQVCRRLEERRKDFDGKNN